MSNPFLDQLPHAPGVYLMRDAAARLVYIGKAVDLRRRVASYFRPEGLDPRLRALMEGVRHIDYIPAESEREALLVERRLIHRHQPLYNVLWKDGKSYPYVVLTREDFPRLRLTRRRRRGGGLYFGPYPNVSDVRGLLEDAWKRRLFPLRPCDLEFSASRLPPEKKVRSCLYLHTGQCPAPCVGKISKADYGRLADQAVLFFKGENDALAHRWETDMKDAARKLDFERAARLRDNLAALRHVNERVTFRAVRPEEVLSRLSRSRAVTDLQAVLGLARPPVRIEGFDISHVQGSDTVASLVVFENGRPLKSDYRKFIMKSVAGVDDFASLAEAVGRRYRRVEAEGTRRPDLVLVDGGPGQLSAAVKAMKEATSRPVPLASLAKREEEVFLPGRAEPLRLPRESPALQLLQSVRDESHRFALAFHRARRGKRVYFK
jgi:excinuclease ABC subunit C